MNEMILNHILWIFFRICRSINKLRWLQFIIHIPSDSVKILNVGPSLQIFQEQFGVYLRAHTGDFRENLLGKSSFVKIGQKVSRCFLEDLSMLQCIRRHYIVICMHCLPEKLNNFVSVA